MATRNFTLAPLATTDAGQRAIFAEVLASFLAMGWVQTTDSGQADPATVVRATAANTASGYLVFRMNDAHQSSYPVFVKVEIGNANYSSNPAPQIWMTIGKGTDGAGAITGELLARTALTNTAASGTYPTSNGTALSGITAGDGGSIALLPWLSAPLGIDKTYGWFMIERSPSGDSLMVCVPGYAGSSSFAALSTAGLGSAPAVYAITHATGYQTIGYVPVLLPNRINGVTLGASASLAAGAVGPVFPWVILAPGMAPWQSSLALTYPGGDTPGSLSTSCSPGRI